MEAELSIASGIARVTLSRPPLNILDNETMESLRACLAEARIDDEVRAVLVQARGRVFSAGVEVRELDAAHAAVTTETFHRMCLELLSIEVPTVALVEGVASGAACALALLCDVVYASDQAKFGHPELRLGLLATASAALYPRRFGPRAAAELLLTCDQIDAHAAEARGFITRAYPGRDARDRTEELLERLAGLSVPLLRAAKRALQAASGLDVGAARQALDASSHVFLEEMVPTEDAQEGLRAFLEKRKPIFKNR